VRSQALKGKKETLGLRVRLVLKVRKGKREHLVFKGRKETLALRALKGKKETLALRVILVLKERKETSVPKVLQVGTVRTVLQKSKLDPGFGKKSVNWEANLPEELNPYRLLLELQPRAPIGEISKLHNSMEPYQPIDCDLYDELIALAMRRSHCRIQYRDAQHQRLTIDDQLVDVYTQDKQEFLKLKSGHTIRLDALISINDLHFND
jgi:Rho-binding antiterminator